MSEPKKRICALVVDDNADVAESFARLLLALGCEAAYVTDPHKALKEAERLKPHIAFLDIGMPEIDGYRLAHLLRRQFGEELKVVAVTAYASAQDRRAARRAGFDAHVSKPIDIAVVESIIKTVLPNY